MDLVVQHPISLRCCFPHSRGGCGRGRGGGRGDRVGGRPQCIYYAKSQLQRSRLSTVSSALPETAISVAIAGTIVGVAATLLVQRTKTSESTQLKIELKECQECGGSGICSACKGEGFVLRKRSDESAERARTQAKNMATRFTAGLPKKWSYCTKCSAARSCSTCGGSGKLSSS